MGAFSRTMEFNERVLQRLKGYELMLLDSSTLSALLDVLLVTTPTHFDLTGVSLTLHDPDGAVSGLVGRDSKFAGQLTLEKDSFDLQQLYGARPEVEYLVSQDPRALRAIANVESGQSAVMLPLVRDGIVVGSFHWVSGEPKAFTSDVERDFLNQLAEIIAICLANCINAERLATLSLLDPLTRLSGRRAFELELRKELAEAYRSKKPVTLMLMDVDDFSNIRKIYGHLTADFVLRCIARNVTSMLRGTDVVARVGGVRFALLLPSSLETKGQEIAERIRSEMEFMEINDGRGGNLFVSLSIGLTSWSPQNYPAINMEHLASQFKSVAERALEKSAGRGGNCVSVSRLAPMLV
jgi:diguanylate cyclase (GGDEF)-like protein